MAYTVTPGVRQDHKGRLYRNASWPWSSKTIMVPATIPPIKDFRVVYEHIWHFRSTGVSVERCLNGCRVCKAENAWYSIEKESEDVPQSDNT